MGMGGRVGVYVFMNWCEYVENNLVCIKFVLLQSESLFQLLSPLVQDQSDQPTEPVSLSYSGHVVPFSSSLSLSLPFSLTQKTSARSNGW